MASYDDLASRLKRAYQGEPVAPLRDGLDTNDVDGAYAVQQINTDAWMVEGRKIVGRKIGLTSPAVQAQLGVDQPDFGVLFDDMSIEDGAALSPKAMLQPKAEAEVAIVLKDDLDLADCTPEQFATACDYAVASIEIVDSRIADWKISFADTVADNGSSARFVLGKERRPLDGLDLYSCGMVLEVDGQIVSVGAGAACLGHPMKAGAWLAQTLARRGAALQAGDVVLTGALGPMVTLEPGQTITAKIGGLGQCSFRYEDSEI